MKIKIVPGILENNLKAVEKKLAKVEGMVDEVMIDLIDGKFTNNKTVEAEELADVTTKLSLGVHLMTVEPIEMVEICAEAGVDRVIGQIELMGDQSQFVRKVKSLGMIPGLGVDLKTGIDFIDEEVVEKVKHILLMAVPAGFSGQEFEIKVLEKITRLRRDLGFSGNVWVDGGINSKTIKMAAEAGANYFSVTSGLWKAEDVKKEYGKLFKLAGGRL